MPTTTTIGTQPCCPYHPTDADPWQAEKDRRTAARQAELAALLTDTPCDQHEAVVDDFEDGHADADLDLYDPGFLDPCPGCGKPIPQGYQPTISTENPAGDAESGDVGSQANDADHAPAELEHAIRDIVGLLSGYAGEQHLACRRLVITAIDAGNGYAGHVIVSLTGSPPRGAVCVNLTHNAAFDSRHVSSGEVLSQADVDLIRSFVSTLTGKAPILTPADFRWISEVKLAT